MAGDIDAVVDVAREKPPAASVELTVVVGGEKAEQLCRQFPPKHSTSSRIVVSKPGRSGSLNPQMFIPVKLSWVNIKPSNCR